jgi:anti-sigma factor RsiW
MVRRSRPQETCDSRDQELLLYVHGALPPMAKMRTARHLRGCSACQHRVSTFLAASGVFADTLRGDQLPRWRPPTGNGWIPATPTSSLIAIGLIGIILFSGTMVVHQVRASVPQYASVESAMPPEGPSMCKGKKGENTTFVSSPAIMPTPASSPTPAPTLTMTAPKVGQLGAKSSSCLQCH